jgi:competence protein ComEA
VEIHRSVRVGIMATILAMVAALVWMGVGQYRAEQRVLMETAAAPAEGDAASSPAGEAAAAPAGLPAPAAAPATAPAPAVVVHVAGAVVNPGVYRLQPDARVQDALTAAGGAKPDGVPDLLNLAAPVRDGDKIFVYTAAEAKNLTCPPPAAAGTTNAPVRTVQGGGSPGSRPEVPPAPVGKVNVNTATVEELDRVSGISPSLARAIVAYREQHGPFRRWEELDAVPGVGPATLAKMKEHLTF